MTEVRLRDRVKDREGDTLGPVVAITEWAVDGPEGPTSRWDIGVKPDRSDRITWLDSERVRVTKATVTQTSKPD